MTFIEFIGFVISVGAMVFLFARQTWENYRRRNYPEEYAQEVRKKDDALKELLKSMNIDLEEEIEEDDEEAPPQPPTRLRPQLKKGPPPLIKKPVPTLAKARLDTEEQFKEYSSERMNPTKFVPERDAYATRLNAAPSRGRTLIDGLRSPRDLFLIKEIMGTPRCDQEWK